MTDRVKKAIDIFLDALNAGTLAKGSCAACAVGNLIANGLGCKLEKWGKSYDWLDKNGNPVQLWWQRLFFSDEDGQNIKLGYLRHKNVMEQIEATDFSWQELARIEEVFETSSEIDFNDYRDYTTEEIREDQIKGLNAVVKLMFEMDAIKESVEEQFTNKTNVTPRETEKII